MIIPVLNAFFLFQIYFSVFSISAFNANGKFIELWLASHPFTSHPKLECVFLRKKIFSSVCVAEFILYIRCNDIGIKKKKKKHVSPSLFKRVCNLGHIHVNHFHDSRLRIPIPLKILFTHVCLHAKNFNRMAKARQKTKKKHEQLFDMKQYLHMNVHTRVCLSFFPHKCSVLFASDFWKRRFYLSELGLCIYTKSREKTFREI